MTFDAPRPGDPSFSSKPVDTNENTLSEQELSIRKTHFLEKLEATLETGGIRIAEGKLLGGVTSRPLEESVVKTTVQEAGENTLPFLPEIFLVTNFGIDWKRPHITLRTGRQRHEYEATEREHMDVTDLTLVIEDILPGMRDIPMHPFVMSDKRGAFLDNNHDRFSKEKTYGSEPDIRVGQTKDGTSALVIVIATGQDEMVTFHAIEGEKADWDVIFKNGKLISDRKQTTVIETKQQERWDPRPASEEYGNWNEAPNPAFLREKEDIQSQLAHGNIDPAAAQQLYLRNLITLKQRGMLERQYAQEQLKGGWLEVAQARELHDKGYLTEEQLKKVEADDAAARADRQRALEEQRAQHEREMVQRRQEAEALIRMLEAQPKARAGREVDLSIEFSGQGVVFQASETTSVQQDEKPVERMTPKQRLDLMAQVKARKKEGKKNQKLEKENVQNKKPKAW